MLGQVFDPKQELLIGEQCRPHWAQSGTIVFVTFRTFDSIPSKVLERWEEEKREWLEFRNIRGDIHWSKAVELLSPADRATFAKHFNRMREELLDNSLGQCVLRNQTLASVVADSLLHFDGERYRMGDFVIMPNHVHLLCAFGSAESMQKQFNSWLHFTAVQINKRLGTSGKFWQSEPFDHLVRSPEQYEYLRDYIRDNPKKARLREGEFFYRRYEAG
ncbi:transposase [Aeoliella sp.]|uniref:transposase n=1 Tax=Aeoliella sp. TaxID=2795800 RepID=UPI003CCC2460